MPPLMTVEKRLFQLISAGLLLLTLSIASGLFFLEDMFAQGKSHKAILSILAWCVYALLLWGHHTRGWRGRKGHHAEPHRQLHPDTGLFWQPFRQGSAA